MSKSRFVLDRFAKLIEQGLLNYKDLSEEIINILKSKRDENQKIQMNLILT